ncbi:MAG: hypothetical protein GX577_09765 [Leptolinea sp.]|nr:hypothetical protein [Leptolinea sp.]
MSPLVIEISILFAVIILIMAALWFIIPLASGLPWVPALDRRIRAAFRLAELQPGEMVYDLGAGDGRVLVIAAREFSARAVGIEISPIHCLSALARIRLAGVGSKASMQWGNFYRSDFSAADVVFIYATSRYANRIIPLLETQLKMGARVVTISSNLDKWQPECIDRENLVFLYRMPPIFAEMDSSLTEQSFV